MTISNAAIKTAVDSHIAALVARGDKTAVSSDIRDLCEGYVKAFTDAGSSLAYNANGLRIVKGRVIWMGADVPAPYDTLPAKLGLEAISTLLLIRDEMLARLAGKTPEE